MLRRVRNPRGHRIDVFHFGHHAQQRRLDAGHQFIEFAGHIGDGGMAVRAGAPRKAEILPHGVHDMPEQRDRTENAPAHVQHVSRATREGEQTHEQCCSIRIVRAVLRGFEFFDHALVMLRECCHRYFYFAAACVTVGRRSGSNEIGACLAGKLFGGGKLRGSSGSGRHPTGQLYSP